MPKPRSFASLKRDLKAHAKSERAKHSPRFFKAGPGEYAEGDKFYGVSVPDVRMVAKTHRNLSLDELQKVLGSPIHEERLCALFILVDQYAKGDERGKQKIYNLYLANTKFVNNWDLVDSSAHKIVGRHLFDNPNYVTTFRGTTFKGVKILDFLAKSDSLWDRRIAAISTFWFIAHDRFDESVKIAKSLLHDEHDLIHKAVGWMLREVGKKNPKAEEDFLKKYSKTMPRTMLRYAIERFPETKRLRYLKGQI